MNLLPALLLGILLSVTTANTQNAVVNSLAEAPGTAGAFPGPRSIRTFYPGEIGNRHGKHFEVSFVLQGNAVICFYARDHSVTYSGSRPDFVMLDQHIWFRAADTAVPPAINWVSTHRYNFQYPTIDDVEGGCSVQTESYGDRFLLHIMNANGFNRIRLFLPFKLVP